MTEQTAARCANGHEAAPDRTAAPFCAVCGAPMMVVCRNGHEVKAATYCSVCGVPVGAAAFGGAGPSAAGPYPGEDMEQAGPAAAARAGTRRHRFEMLAAALLVLLIGGGAYFGVSAMTGSSGGKTSAAAVSSLSSSAGAQPSPAAVAPPSTNPVLSPSAVTSTVGQPLATLTVTSASPAPAVSAPPPAPAAPVVPVAPAIPAPAVAGAAQVVEEYFNAINAGDYALAWSLGGANIQRGSYDSFVQGFANTVADAVTVDSVSGDVVAVQLAAEQTDGTYRYFAGTYTVEGGVIVHADIH